MATPIFYLPALTTNPVGWAVLGVAGYLAYAAGRKAGQKSQEEIEQVGLPDRAVKGAMKSAYKAKLKGDAVLADAREKYGTMWREARDEVRSVKE
ncbi:hypothetical protein [Desulfobulbus alkaliphilus]|uniref:hypothetical protein n=1 Tax=Desulfobulbus alkaliphilus TaxID=869814 RepID=UPI001964CC6C|nr:hypothetical protein [Desulfobulbus alkaliphilus]MBM9538701.1 hypothetical protein [Desulfobulbus alkaliphilus]